MASLKPIIRKSIRLARPKTKFHFTKSSPVLPLSRIVRLYSETSTEGPWNTNTIVIVNKLWPFVTDSCIMWNKLGGKSRLFRERTKSIQRKPHSFLFFYFEHLIFIFKFYYYGFYILIQFPSDLARIIK